MRAAASPPPNGSPDDRGGNGAALADASWWMPDATANTAVLHCDAAD